jgi:hypothetical protein
LIGTFRAVWQPAFTALFTRKQQGIQQTSILIRSKKWLLQIEKQSLCWATTGSICVVGTSGRWDVDAIELLSKYGLTPQLEIGQKVSGSRSGGGFPSSSAFVSVD